MHWVETEVSSQDKSRDRESPGTAGGTVGLPTSPLQFLVCGAIFRLPHGHKVAALSPPPVPTPGGSSGCKSGLPGRGRQGVREAPSPSGHQECSPHSLSSTAGHWKEDLLSKGRLKHPAAHRQCLSGTDALPRSQHRLIKPRSHHEASSGETEALGS